MGGLHYGYCGLLLPAHRDVMGDQWITIYM